ncbi:molybdopterin synthase subunit MoaD [Caldanaerovirga acetigignens]|uniref:Molybdopterin synthase subunit MoaD n=1 Tax=Caldanaerovirga acetigignens TaxID=447595 RepID=A0A1M7HS00_9FIRM|nr:MoaD/ThiS family protein [Caldanaerovirga acetigignens]SHM31179.1 molybdopterin synthase subunit MoaD [Caldanaerovirga acetigignens]
MASIKVIFFGQLRTLTGTRETTIALEDNSVLSHLISHLDKEYKDFETQMNSINGLRILINGQEYELIGGLKTPLHDGDTVVFLPPIFGG